MLLGPAKGPVEASGAPGFGSLWGASLRGLGFSIGFRVYVGFRVWVKGVLGHEGTLVKALRGLRSRGAQDL